MQEEFRKKIKKVRNQLLKGERRREEKEVNKVEGLEEKKPMERQPLPDKLLIPPEGSKSKGNGQPPPPAGPEPTGSDLLAPSRPPPPPPTGASAYPHPLINNNNHEMSFCN